MKARLIPSYKSAMQSAHSTRSRWKIVFDNTEGWNFENIMKWAGSNNTQIPVQLEFDSLIEAQKYASSHHIDLEVEIAEKSSIAPKSYISNFLRAPYKKYF